MKYSLSSFVALVALALAPQVQAKCASSAPSANAFEQAKQSGDKSVGASWMKKNLVGRQVDFGQGNTENYLADGGYFYKTPSATWTPKGYRFYRNGLRCLDYPNGPRYDMYVVNSGKLYLINAQGQRFQGKLRKLK